jgi:hypothetical protein
MSRHFWRWARLCAHQHWRFPWSDSSPFPKTIPLQRTLGVSSEDTVTGDLVFVEITDASII